MALRSKKPATVSIFAKSSASVLGRRSKISQNCMRLSTISSSNLLEPPWRSLSRMDGNSLQQCVATPMNVILSDKEASRMLGESWLSAWWNSVDISVSSRPRSMDAPEKRLKSSNLCFQGGDLEMLRKSALPLSKLNSRVGFSSLLSTNAANDGEGGM